MSRETGRMLPLQTIVMRVTAELLKRGPISNEKVSFAWQIAVGNAITNATTVRLRPPDVLEVTAADERWQREIERSSHMILSRLDALLGEKVVGRLQVVRRRPGSRTPKPESRIPNPESRGRS